MRAVVMAGGLGTRLRPLTTAVPKPLLPVLGRPMLEHTLLLARDHGIDDVVLTVQHLSPMIRRRIGGGGDLGVSITYATEPRPMGTAGGVRLAIDGSDDEHLLILSGDAVTDVDLGLVMSHHLRSGSGLTMALTRRNDPREFGLVDVDDAGWVRRFREKPEWGEIFGDTVSTGIYVVSRSVLDGIPTDTPWDWSTDVIPRLLAEQVPVAGIVVDGYWEDVGDVSAYRRVQVDALDGRVRLHIPGVDRGDGVWLGEGVELAAGCDVEGPAFIGARSVIDNDAQVLAYSVLGAHCLVRRGARIQHSTLHDNVYLGSNVDIRGAVIGRGTEVGAGSRADESVVIADGCVLERDVELTAGSLVYPGRSVESGTVVTGSLVWDSKGHRSLIDARGMRGEMGVDITPEAVVRLASALGTLLHRGTSVALGHDHSVAAATYVSILAGALRAAGLHVHLLRATPLPVLRDHVRHRADAGVYLRLSERRDDSLDIVIVRSDGSDLGERAREVNRIYERREFRRAVPGAMGTATEQPTAAADYAERIRSRVPGGAARGLRVVIDAMGGTASIVLPGLFEADAAELVLLGTRPDPQSAAGGHAHVHARLAEVSDMVVATHAALGIVVDPSGERLWLVDEQGRILDDDRALLVALDLVSAESHEGRIIVPSTASSLAEPVARYHGVDVRRALHSAIFTHNDGALLIGDAAGGFAVPGAGGQRDAIAATYALVGWVSRTHLTLSAINERIPTSSLLQVDVETPWRTKALVVREIAARAGARHTDFTDGVRIVEDDGAWCLALPDPAEALTRLWVEAPSSTRALEVAREWTNAVRDIVASQHSVGAALEVGS